MSAEPFAGHPVWGEGEEATPDPLLPPQQAQGQPWGRMLSFAGPQNAVSKLPSCCLRERGINEASAGPRGTESSSIQRRRRSQQRPQGPGPSNCIPTRSHTLLVPLVTTPGPNRPTETRSPSPGLPHTTPRGSKTYPHPIQTQDKTALPVLGSPTAGQVGARV